VPAAAPTTSDELLGLIRKSGVLPESFAPESKLPADPVHAANLLVKKGHLTAFQARMLLAGKVRGFRLGDYVIRDQIGQGGMGAVYLAVHQTLGRKVAIKVLPGASAADRLALERFLREARTAAALDHPNIVKLYDVCRQDELRYLVLEYVEGQTLQAVMQTGGISQSRAVGYVAQAAAGLQHAHEKGFIHRDIKPGNLILTADDTVKILDMGLARSIKKEDGLTEAFDRGAIVGTADYVAPEQAMNAPNVDIRADIYSLGVTFYSLVTGRPPFDGSTASKLVQHQLKDAPSLTKLDKTIPPKLAAVVAKMMAKRPEDRYATPADVILALQPWLSNNPKLMAGVSRTEAANNRLSSENLLGGGGPAATRKLPPWVWAAAGGGALAVIATVVAIAMMGGGNTPKTSIGTFTPPATQPTAPPVQPTPPTGRPTTSPTAPVNPAAVAKKWTDGKVVYALDLSQQKPFQVDGGSNGMSNKTGDGDFPAGWSVKTWIADHRAKGFADTTAGGPAIGAKAVAGNAILFSPEIDFTGKWVKVRFEYQSTAAEKLCTVRVREMTSQKTDNTNLPAVAAWTPFEKVYDVAAFKNALRVEFHNSDAGTELRLRNFQVVVTEPAK
jgi:serine/threonine protein kinase